MQVKDTQPAAAYVVRDFGMFNRLGLWTLYVKEVGRFVKVSTQTILAPMVTTLLFFAVFALALGNTGAGGADSMRTIAGVPFLAFLAPGLVMMATVQNAFANTSSSIMISKIQGNIVDVLMPPITAGELLLAYSAAGVTRGIVVAVAVAIAILPFAPLSIFSAWAVAYFAVAGSLMLALLGILGALWSEKFDHIAAVTNFVVTPLAFLSGTFYSIQQLPPVWHLVSQFNPFFYMIDGFRYGFTGHADAPALTGVIVLAFSNAALWLVTHRLLASGYKLKG